MKNLTFLSESNLLDVTALATFDILDLRELCEAANIGHEGSPKATLITKLKIHYNQPALVVQRMLADELSKRSKAPDVTEDADYLAFLAFKEAKAKGVANTGPVTTVPYTQLAVGTVLQKNGTVLLVAAQPAKGVTLLASVKLAWHNTNDKVTGLGSTVLQQGTGTLPETFNNPTWDVCLTRAKALIYDNKVKTAKADLKRISELNNAGEISERALNFLTRFADKLQAEKEQKENNAKLAAALQAQAQTDTQAIITGLSESDNMGENENPEMLPNQPESITEAEAAMQYLLDG